MTDFINPNEIGNDKVVEAIGIHLPGEDHGFPRDLKKQPNMQLIE